MKRTQLQRRTPPKRRGPISPASPEQRAKVKDRICLNCGDWPCDPAHLTPRSMGGCDSELCVIPLCRICHDVFDGHTNYPLDLEPILALRHMAPERAHMASHMSFIQCQRRLRREM